MIEWIPVSVRVPCNRRKVMTWGVGCVGKPKFLGVSQYNACGSSGLFDNQRSRPFLIPPPIVTHWAEITGPEEVKS